MTIQQMKEAIVHVYGTASWTKKVEGMYDDQVIAIYHNFAKRGILGKVVKRERPGAAEKREQNKRYQQMTIYDFLK